MSEELEEILAASTHTNITNRGLTQATCRHWDYRTRINHHGEGEHIAVYRDEHGTPIGAKVRNLGKDGKGKSFRIIGDISSTPYGLHLMGNGGKMLVIAGGEIDVLTVSQLWSNSFPVIGPPTGEKSMAKIMALHLDRINKFDKVVLCLDMDEVGTAANIACAQMLPPGKAFIAVLPRKDPNEMHMAGEDKQLTGLLHNAPAYSPGGIISGRELAAQALEAPAWGLRYGIEFLDNLQWGWRDGEVVVCLAGTGMGKSDLMYQVAASIMKDEQQPCAVFNHEASPSRILLGIAGKQAHKRFTLPDPDGVYWTEEERRQAIHNATEVYAQPYVNDSKGTANWTEAKERIRYLAHAHGVKRFFFDPLGAYAAQMENETKGIDLVMWESVGLCEELGVGIWWNTHLTKSSDGASYEEGGRVHLRDARGSGSISIVSALAIAIERDQQADDPEDRNVTTLRALKVREAGENTGQTAKFLYNVITGDLEQANTQLGGEQLPSAPPTPEDLQ